MILMGHFFVLLLQGSFFDIELDFKGDPLSAHIHCCELKDNFLFHNEIYLIVFFFIVSLFASIDMTEKVSFM